MGAYLPLLSIKVKHEYFADGLCHGLKFVPSPECDVLIKKLGLLLKVSDNAIAIFYDEEHLEMLQSYAKDQDEPLRLGFRVFCADKNFQNYTGLNIPKDKPLLMLSNRTASTGEGAQVYLHSGEFVDADCYWAIDPKALCESGMVEDLTQQQRDKVALLKSLITRSDEKVPPCFVVAIEGVDDNAGFFDSDLNITPRDFAISFKSRESYWKYYLIGDIGLYQPGVVDVDDDHLVAFSSLTEELLPDGRKVWSVMSNAMLAMREHSDYRFQLKTAANGSGKVLIKRLPVASASRISRNMVDGKDVFISEIFVNF